ncbi:hypothetical protein SAMN05421821_102560 [Mucilaginibacter lappiensis]|nr:hypothetical protein SAMN05421821_102560 [Mucilaginibacter lappiensis]
MDTLKVGKSFCFKNAKLMLKAKGTKLKALFYTIVALSFLLCALSFYFLAS